MLFVRGCDSPRACATSLVGGGSHSLHAKDSCACLPMRRCIGKSGSCLRRGCRAKACSVVTTDPSMTQRSVSLFQLAKLCPPLNYCPFDLPKPCLSVNNSGVSCRSSGAGSHSVLSVHLFKNAFPSWDGGLATLHPPCMLPAFRLHANFGIERGTNLRC